MSRNTTDNEKDIEFNYDNLEKNEKDALFYNTTKDSMKNILEKNRLAPKGISKFNKTDLFNKFISLSKDQTNDEYQRKNLKIYLRDRLNAKPKGKEKIQKKKGKEKKDTPTKGSTYSPTETEDN